MTDAELKRRWKRIVDPRKALCEIVDQEDLFGHDDPYYEDLRSALLEMARRICQEPR